MFNSITHLMVKNITIIVGGYVLFLKGSVYNDCIRDVWQIVLDIQNKS